MKRANRSVAASAAASAVLGLLLALPAATQGQSGGARPNGAAGGAGNTGAAGWPRTPQVEAPSRLPQDTAFGVKGSSANSVKAGNASTSAKDKAAAKAKCAKAKAALAAAGTGGSTANGQGDAAGGEGRAKAVEAACSGVAAEPAVDAGKSAQAPGQTGVTGTGQAIQRANENAKESLERAIDNQTSPGASEVRKPPEQKPPQ
jgi:hypothetical protein